MLVALAGRFLRAVATVFVAFSLVFVAIRLTPGGPAVSMLGQRATQEAVDRLNREMGWDRPLGTQLVQTLSRALRGDLGIAYLSAGKTEVLADLARRFPATIELTLAALLIAIPVGVSAGMIAARYRGGWPDRLAIALSSLGVSVPVFFLGIVLLLIFRDMPGSGRIDVRTSMRGVEWTGLYVVDSVAARRWDILSDVLAHLILPAMTLASVPTALIARVTRSSLLEVLSSDFIRTARAKGASQGRALVRHALPASSAPIVSLLGMQLATLLAGAVLTETAFTWPGVGRYVMLAATNKDYNALQGSVLLLGMVFIAVNVLTDLICVALDPRLRIPIGGAR